MRRSCLLSLGTVVASWLFFVDGLALSDSKISSASLQLLKAAYAGSEAGVLQALRSGADINATATYAYLTSLGHDSRLSSDLSDDTALVLAVKERHVGVVKILLEHGADPSDRGGGVGSSSVLDTAIWWNNLPLVTLLLEHGADPNARDGNYLHLGEAAREGNTKMVQVLIKHGANINAQDGFGETALHKAATGGGLEGVPSSLGFLDKYAKTMRLLLDSGADPHLRDQFDATPLMKSAGLGYKQGVELLIEYGAKVDTTDDKDNSALIAAAAGAGGLSLIKLLLKAGVDVNAANADGNTALHVAADHEEGLPRTIELLLDNGADAHAVNKEGKTARDIAVAEHKNAQYILSRPDIAYFYRDPKGRAKRHGKAVKILQQASE